MHPSRRHGKWMQVTLLSVGGHLLSTWQTLVTHTALLQTDTKHSRSRIALSHVTRSKHQDEAPLLHQCVCCGCMTFYDGAGDATVCLEYQQTFAAQLMYAMQTGNMLVHVYLCIFINNTYLY